MAPKCNYKCLYKRRAEGNLTQKTQGGVQWQQGRFEDTMRLALKLEEGTVNQGMQL